MGRKRCSALTVTMMLLWLSIFPLISGCTSSEKETGYTVSEWLDKVEDTFNMNYYTTEEPLIQTVMRDNEWFDTIQTAAEWGLVSADQQLDFNGALTKDLCLNTLNSAAVMPDGSKAIGDSFLTGAGSDSLTKEQADEALAAAYDKWINFSFNGENFDKSVVHDNVINFGGLSDEVSKLNSLSPADYRIKYSGDTNLFTNGKYSDNTVKTFIFYNKDAVKNIEAGSVLSMPANEFIPVDYAVVVDSVTENDDGTVSVLTHNAEAKEVYDTYEFRKSGPVDFSEAVFYTPDGQKMSWSDGYVVPPEDMTYDSDMVYDIYDYDGGNYTYSERKSGRELNNMLYTGGTQKLMNSGRGGETRNMSLGAMAGLGYKLGNGLKISASSKINSQGDVELTIKGSYKVEDGDGSITVEFSDTVGLSLDADGKISFAWDWPPIKIDRAYLKVTSKNELKIKFAVGLKKDGDIHSSKDDITISEDTKNKLKKVYDGFTELMQDNKKAGQLASKCGCDIFNLALPDGFWFKVRLYVNLEGELEIGVTSESSIGVQYVPEKKKFIPIRDSKITPEISLEAKVEVTLGFALTWDLLKKTIADVEFEAGVGVKLSSKIYEYNEATGGLEATCGLLGLFVANTNNINGTNQGISLAMANTIADVVTSPSGDMFRSCTELEVYPIARLNLCTDQSVIGEYFFSASIDFSEAIAALIPVFNPKWHWESDMGWVDECTRGVAGGYDIKTGKDLTFSPEYDTITLAVGEDFSGLKIGTMPKGIKVEDVVISSEDKSVVSAENLMTSSGKNPEEKQLIKFSVTLLGLESESAVFYKDLRTEDGDQFKITGIADGVTKLTVIAGGQSRTINVVVGNGGIEESEANKFIIDNTYIDLKKGGKASVKVTAAPAGYNISSLSFSSSNPAVATVDNFGNITANDQIGSAMIYISTNDGKYNAVCLVTVSS